MSVTWVVNGNSKHEISSKEHLLQLMSNGTLYTDAGSPPATYLDGDYEQTVDIDLEADSNITPIGDSTSRFTGSYDGAGFSISNWIYTTSNTDSGLFGYTQSAVLEHIRLTGVWVLTNGTNRCGFLCGHAFVSTQIRDVHGIFDVGTSIDCPTAQYVGGLVGESFSTNMYGLRVTGTVDMTVTTTGERGGIGGRFTNGNMYGLTNGAMWPNGITGRDVGGVIGETGFDGQIFFFMNVMIGDLVGTDNAGGIIGVVNLGGGTDSFDTMVNSMKGDIIATTNAGGIVGESNAQFGQFVPTECMNYMTGDITGGNTSGGFIGEAGGSNALSITNSINAMNGTVDEAIIGTTSVSTSVTSTKYDTSFGLSFTTATHGSASATLSGYTTSPNFTALDYVPFTFTDNASNSYEFEMVFGNVGGNATYSQYTHAVLSKDDILGPYYVDFDLTGNSTEYVTYFLAEESGTGYTDGSLTVLDSNIQVIYDYAETVILVGSPTTFITITPRVIDAGAVIDAISGVTHYSLTIQAPSGDVVFTDNSFTEMTKTFASLLPSTIYTLSLFTSPDGITFTLLENKQFTTLANFASNYNTSVYMDGSGFDLSDLDTQARETISEVLDDLFSTSDAIKITDASGDVYDSVFLNLNGTVTIGDAEAVFIPFDASLGSGQQGSVTLSDNTSTLIEFNESTGDVTVGGVVYTVGQSFILDGKRMLVSQ